MPDREKVIKGLEVCCDVDGNCYDCPYTENGEDPEQCDRQALRDALALLKEQDAMAVDFSVFNGVKYGGCPRCNARIDNLVNPKACGYCGQEVRWE